MKMARGIDPLKETSFYSVTAHQIKLQSDTSYTTHRGSQMPIFSSQLITRLSIPYTLLHKNNMIIHIILLCYYSSDKVTDIVPVITATIESVFHSRE
jgi:hypothetical protein